MTAPDPGVLVDELRGRPDGADALAALLPEHLAVHRGLSAAEAARLRGYILAALAGPGLPPAALPYVLESLETGHVADEVAGAAIALRGSSTAGADVDRALARAVRNLAGADATVSFESYRPRWPYAQPTSVLTEIARTVTALGLAGGAARAELDRQGGLPAEGGCCGTGSCGCCAADATPSGSGGTTSDRTSEQDGPLPDLAGLDVVLEDQDGRTTTFDALVAGRPAVLAFFYTRCDNPWKCSLTITRLADLQRALADGGWAAEVTVAAITYDPDFDVPQRLRAYGLDRGFRFGGRARFLRVPAGFEQVRERFGLAVNYGGATVNRHRTEVFVLDAVGAVAAAFTRTEWDPADVLEALGAAVAP